MSHVGSPRLSAVGFLPVKLENPNVHEHLREIARAANNILGGKLNTRGTLTLTASDTTTAVTDARVSPTSRIHLMPTTLSAAGALATTYVSSRGDRTFTVTHSSDAATDRTFEYDVIG
jgi:hypothetical protein